MQRHAAAASGKAMAKRHNDDNFYLNGRYLNFDGRSQVKKELLEKDDIALYAVLDGTGDGAFGAKASFAYAKNMLEMQPQLVSSSPLLDTSLQLLVTHNLQETAKQIEELAKKEALRRLGGADVAGIVFHDNKATIFHTGNARAYLLRAGRILRLTSTHIDLDFSQDYYTRSGDIFFLCTDGLWDAHTEHTLHAAFSCFDLASAVDLLVVDALEKNPSQHATILAIEIIGDGDQIRKEDRSVEQLEATSIVESSATTRRYTMLLKWAIPLFMTILVTVLALLLISEPLHQIATTGTSSTTTIAKVITETSESLPQVETASVITTENTTFTEIIASTPQPTISPEPSLTPTPSVAPNPTPQPTLSPSPKPSVSPTPMPTVAPTPAPTPIPTTQPSVITEPIPYVIQPGDGLMSISRKFYGSADFVTFLMEKNNIANARDIKVGQIINIYPVKK